LTQLVVMLDLLVCVCGVCVFVVKSGPAQFHCPTRAPGIDWRWNLARPVKQNFV